MTEDLKQYEKTIKKKHSIKFTPSYKEETNTSLNSTVFIAIVEQVIERLGWEVAYVDENLLEAQHTGSGWNKLREKITIEYNYGKVKVKSESLGSEMWDKGRNSLRVKLFIHALNQIEKEYDREALAALEAKVKRAANMDDYVIPESLPQPKAYRRPQFSIPLVGGILVASILGLLLAWLSIEAIYIIFLFEVGVALAMGFALGYLIKWSNYTNENKLLYLLFSMVVATYVLNQYFLYLFILDEHGLEPIGFFNFLNLKLENGLKIKDLNLGSIGLVISWVIQIGLTYAVGWLRLYSYLISYKLERVPEEVVEFTVYHLVKGKNEHEIRAALSKMGWSDERHQQDVFDAIGASYQAAELNRS